MRIAPAIELTQEQEAELRRLSRSKRASVRLAQRAKIVMLAAQGLQNKDIAERLGTGRVQVARWRERYLHSGLQGIERDLPRGAPPVKVDVAKLVDLTTQSTPEAATHWSTRKMAAVLVVNHASQRKHGDAPLAGQRTEAAFDARLQGLARPQVRREVGGHRGPVRVPARARAA